MRYVRTKNGHIFKIEKDLGKYRKSKAVIICDFDGNFIDVKEQNNILKQADTIEELCDEFVFIVDNRTPYNFAVWDERQVKHYLYDCYDKKHCVVYGAIWTDKGLIYVAKMNEKGELELL